MKLPTFVSFILVLIGLTSAAQTNKAICKKKNPRVVSAIEIYCKNTGLTVPSLYAKTGVHYAPNGAQSPNDLYLYIDGTCSPVQWVPQKYCLSQFYSICATGGERGMGSKSFGRNGCQDWHIIIQKPGVKITPVT